MCDLLDTSQTLHSWVLSSGSMCLPSSVTRECQWLADPLEGGELSDSACFLEGGSVGCCNVGTYCPWTPWFSPEIVP